MHTQPHVIFVNGLAQSGAGKSRRCCLPDVSECYHVVSLAVTHRQSACYLHLVTLKLSFTCTSPLKQGWHARSLARLASVACTHANHSVSSTDTSTCYPHLVSWTDTSACYLHLVTPKLISTCKSPSKQGRNAHSLTRLACTLFNTAGMHAL